jgi:hypothetical protein
MFFAVFQEMRSCSTASSRIVTRFSRVSGVTAAIGVSPSTGRIQLSHRPRASRTLCCPFAARCSR